MLNIEQETAVRSVLSAYQKGAVAFSLSGPPGVGKTYTTGEIVRCFKHINLTVAVTASTNKAVDVIKAAAIDGGWYHHVSWWGTVHKLLGLVVDVDDDNRLVKLGYNRAGRFDVVVIDESSMLGDDIVKAVRAETRFVLFVGDKNQLPPVGEELPTAFITAGAELSTSVRHAGNEQLQALVNYVKSAISEDATHIPTELLEPFAVRDLEEWQNGIGTSSNEVALAFTNAEVGRINRILRKGRKQEYVPGDRLVFTGPFYRNRQLLFATSELVTVQEAARTTNKNYPVWSLRVKGNEYGYVQVLNTEGENNVYIQYLEDEGFPKPQLAQLAYGYALTVHRSQGSEFDTVHVNMEDIRRCQDLEQRRKLAYVAFSRAKSALRIYTRG